MNIIVIGGGAAGFFSAINIARNFEGVKITILEKTTKLLAKVKVSGGGRCNVTHACFDPKELVENYPRGRKELLGPFHHFMTGDTIEWFENRGVELKIEEDGRIFPKTDSSQTIVNCFLKEASQLNIKIVTNCKVLGIQKKSDFSITTDQAGVLRADFVIGAIGGSPKLNHYHLFQELGHTIIDPIPSLFTFNLPRHPSNQLMGLAIPAQIKICKTDIEVDGPILFTHWGLSGPAVLKLSAQNAEFLHTQNYQFDFEICWMRNAEKFVADCRKLYAKKQVKNIKIENFPIRFVHYLLTKSAIDSTKNWADLNKEEIAALVKVLEFDVYQAKGKTTFKEEFVTCGGIDLKEVNMKTLESKLVSQLYFCGELLNIDALTGGFNFQAAWTGGYLVSQAISKRINALSTNL